MTRYLEITTNVSILVVSLLLGTVLVREYLIPERQPNAGRSGVAVGERLDVGDLAGHSGMETLVFVLDTRCRFCTESAPFYRRVHSVVKPSRLHLVAVFPQEIEEGKEYLRTLAIPIDDVQQRALSALSVRGTPTIVLLDREGVVQQLWVGKLDEAAQQEVIDMVVRYVS